MGENSHIAWTNHTYNPWIGCTKVGVGCEGCYAEARDIRFEDGKHWGPGAPRRQTAENTRRAPLKWNRKSKEEGHLTKVFAHSLSDVFDNEVDAEWREREFEIWKQTPHLRWIVLTKRPSNIRKMLPRDWSVERYSNVGFCCSVSTQKEYDNEVPKLVQVDAAWLGVSIEPQVERIRLDNIGFWRSDRIKWIITGGASAQPGYDVPAYNTEWARSLIVQCKTRGIACFVKQLGANPWAGKNHLALQHKAGEDPEEWPADIRVREFPERVLT